MMMNYNKSGRSVVVVPIISWRRKEISAAAVVVADPKRMLLQQQHQQQVAAFTTTTANNYSKRNSNNNYYLLNNNNNNNNNTVITNSYRHPAAAATTTTTTTRYNSTSSDGSSSSSNNHKKFSSLAIEEEEEEVDYYYEDHDDHENSAQQQQQQQYNRATNLSSTPLFTTNSRSSNTSSSEGNTSSSSISSTSSSSSSSSSCFNCCTIAMENTHENLPPPLPEPKYSVHKRVLPSTLVELKSRKGRQYLLEALQQNTAESYWCLMEQFLNQSDPAFCGVTTLLMVLNAMDLDPNVRWRGGWRFFGNEDMLLNRCCINPERIRRQGITMEQFSSLARCQGMKVTLKRPPPPPAASDAKDNNSNDNTDHTIDVFRNDIRQILTTQENDNSNNNNGILVVSYSREVLGQTGDGHFSPIAAYHALSDQVLILDVARFKYSPYWVSLELLYQSMQPLDEVSQKPRGWYLCYPPPNNNKTSAAAMADIERLEDRRPAHLVPLSDENRDMCPVGKIKVEFCSAGDDKEEEE